MSKKLKHFEFFKTQVETLGNENWDLGFNLGNAKRKLQLQEENLKHMNEEINILKHKMKNLKLEFEMQNAENLQLTNQNKILQETIVELQIKVLNLKQRFDFYKVIPPTSRIDFSLFNNDNFKAMENNLILLELNDSIR